VAKCSEATLDGMYLTAYDGVDITGYDQVPLAVAEYDVFDDNGNVNGFFSANFGGHITLKEPFSGTYAVKADCTGTLTYTDGTHYDLIIVPDGGVFAFVQTDPKFVTSGAAQRIGP
jgi:hypothetical protein